MYQNYSEIQYVFNILGHWRIFNVFIDFYPQTAQPKANTNWCLMQKLHNKRQILTGI